MCKHLNKTKQDEEEEEVDDEGNGGGDEEEGGRDEKREEGHSPDTAHQLDDHYLQKQNGNHFNDNDDDDAREVNPSTMISNKPQRSTNEMENRISIVDSLDNCLFSRPAANLTNTNYHSSSTKFTISEILKPDFGICKIRKVRHKRALHENVTLLSYHHQAQVISLGSTGGILIPISHYAPSIYSSASCITPTALRSPLAGSPVTVQAQGSSSSLIASSPVSSSSSPSLVRYGSDSISPSSLGLHHQQQQSSSSSSLTFHTFNETGHHHRSRHRAHQHLQNCGSSAATTSNNNNQNNLNHSYRNQQLHAQQEWDQREDNTHQQHPQLSRNHLNQLQQHHSSSNNPRRNKREHFLDPVSSGSSDFTTKESDIGINRSVTSLAIATTINNTLNHDDGDDNYGDKKTTSRNDSVSNELNIEAKESNANTSLYKGAAPFAWPAWVYCTRYSDRPSSGPRSRKLKKRDRSADEKRPRTSFTSDQLLRLKQEFDDCRYLTEDRRKKLARELSLSEAQIKIWFQNKRAKIKKSSGMKNPLALHLMAQGLYNHSTVSIKDEHYNNEATF